VIGLAHHLETAALKPGAHILMIGAGAGFSTSATVVRLTRPVSQPTQGVYA
jgi:3-oxoacyl-[acyl-carrier-protein] synthase III